MQRMLLAATSALLMAMPLASFAADGDGWPLPECGPADIADRDAGQDELDAHRTFALPVLRYAAGARSREFAGLIVKMRVDERGQPACMFRDNLFDGTIQLTPRRSQALRELANGRYRPFLDEDKPVPVFVTEGIAEEDIPAERRAMPDVALAQVRIEQRRTGCLGTCPSYRVEIDGSGEVKYTSGGFVDVRGPLRYRIPAEDVAALVARARAMDFWSLRDEYEGGISDASSTIVTFRMGDEEKRVEDAVGTMDGMPRAMIDLQEAIDAASRVQDFIVLSDRAVDLLVESGFPIRSPDGAAILARATENDELRDEAPLLRLLTLGAPIDAPPYSEGFNTNAPRPPLIESAARHQRRALLEALLAQGVLGTAEQPDAQALQAAFLAAMAGGDLAIVQAIWNFSPNHRPSLSFVSRDPDDDAGRSKRAPVTLALDRYGSQRQPHWDGLAITQWLAAMGANLRASDFEGKTLMHIAADSNDIAFVQWLVANGVNINAQDRDGIPSIGYTDSEDVVIAMLELGARPKDIEGSVAYNHWSRVAAWLAAHAEH